MPRLPDVPARPMAESPIKIVDAALKAVIPEYARMSAALGDKAPPAIDPRAVEMAREVNLPAEILKMFKGDR